MKKNIVYAFIDSQNLNLAIRDQGWKLDFAKGSKLGDKKKRPHKDKTLQGYSSVRDKGIIAKRSKGVKKKSK